MKRQRATFVDNLLEMNNLMTKNEPGDLIFIHCNAELSILLNNPKSL